MVGSGGGDKPILSLSMGVHYYKEAAYGVDGSGFYVIILLNWIIGCDSQFKALVIE